MVLLLKLFINFFVCHFNFNLHALQITEFVLWLPTFYRQITSYEKDGTATATEYKIAVLDHACRVPGPIKSHMYILYTCTSTDNIIVLATSIKIYGYTDQMYLCKLGVLCHMGY